MTKEERSKKIEQIAESWGFCGCGSAEDMVLYVYSFLHLCFKHEWAAYEDHAYMFLCYWADEKGYIEHGTTVRCSWPTEKGRVLMNEIETLLELPKTLDEV